MRPGCSRRVVDDLVEQLAEDVAELGPGLEPEADQIVAVDREIGEPVRVLLLLSQQLPETVELLDVGERRPPVGARLAAVIRLLVVEKLECDLVAVLREEPPRAERIPLAELEHVVADDAQNARAKRVRVAEACERGLRKLAADLLVAFVGEAGLRVVVQPAVGAPPRNVRLAEVVEERREPNGERGVHVRRGLHDLERVLVDRERVITALLIEPDRALELGQELDEHARVAREPKRARGLFAEQQLRQLAHPVGGEAAADPLAGDEPYRLRLGAHLLARRLVDVEAELRDEAQRANEPQRIFREARGRHRPQHAALEILAAVERIDDLARREPARDRVHGEVAPTHVVLDGERRVRDDLEVVTARAGAHFLARRRELDPGRREPADLRVARVEADADEPSVDDEILDSAVRQRARP